jgi:hypothetical protein
LFSLLAGWFSGGATLFQFNRVSVGPAINQPDPSDFAWGAKNPVWDELNIRKGGVCVKNKKAFDVTLQ